MPRLLPAAAALLVLAACAGEPAAPPRPAVAEERADDEVRPGVSLDRILAARGDDGPFLEALREPRRRSAEPVANRHDPARVDTIRTLVYDGLTLEAYAVTEGPTLLQRVTVTGAGYGTAGGLSVGESRPDLEAVLGAPVGEEGGRRVYESGEEPTPTLVEVVYEPDADGVARASEIVWVPYVD